MQNYDHVKMQMEETKPDNQTALGALDWICNQCDPDGEGLKDYLDIVAAKKKIILTALEGKPADAERGCSICGGEADNGFDRCVPPNPYNCSKCDKATRPRFVSCAVRESMPIDLSELPDAERIVELLVTEYTSVELAKGLLTACSVTFYQKLLTQTKERDKIDANFRKGRL